MPKSESKLEYTPGYVESLTLEAHRLRDQNAQLQEALEALVPRLERWLHYGIQGGMGGRDADFAAIKERAEAALHAAKGGE